MQIISFIKQEELSIYREIGKKWQPLVIIGNAALSPLNKDCGVVGG